MHIEGNFDQKRYSFVKINISLCVNKEICRPYNDIINILTNSFVAFYYSNTIVNPKNYDPFTIVGQDTYWSVSPTYPKDI